MPFRLKRYSVPFSCCKNRAAFCCACIASAVTTTPTNGSLFFTIFQTFMSGPPKNGKPSPYFGEYPPDFFDFIVIDKCHRGGANDASNWRGIMDYFAPAVQLGLTATPKRRDNVDTYAYFGEPVYVYSLKEGINDRFLTPFKVKQISTTLDEYVYTPDDKLIEGEIKTGKLYTETDFNKIIEIKEREAHRVKLFIEQINQNEKTLGRSSRVSRSIFINRRWQHDRQQEENGYMWQRIGSTIPRRWSVSRDG